MVRVANLNAKTEAPLAMPTPPLSVDEVLSNIERQKGGWQTVKHSLEMWDGATEGGVKFPASPRQLTADASQTGPL